MHRPGAGEEKGEERGGVKRGEEKTEHFRARYRVRKPSYRNSMGEINEPTEWMQNNPGGDATCAARDKDRILSRWLGVR